ncbi:hypothetical protein LCGC14_1865430 [marine sediment metagenome]|uniref:Uncharacterized protein n=1 Tax=marine sediment metagenome TaxID=412755 RepID=A0A0F9J597_9ZZZZ
MNIYTDKSTQTEDMSHLIKRRGGINIIIRPETFEELD